MPLLMLVLSLWVALPIHAGLTPLAWAENTADCLTDRFGRTGRLVRPAWVEERGVREVEVHLPERVLPEGRAPAETVVDRITTERVVLVWTTVSGEEATTWFDLLWRETGPEPVAPQPEAEGSVRYYRARRTRWLVVEGHAGGHTAPLALAAGTECTHQAIDALWRP